MYLLLVNTVFLVLLSISISVSGTLTCDDGTNLNSCLFSGGFDFFDLSHDFAQNTVYWPNSRRYEVIKMEAGVRSDGSWYAANDFCAGEHGGTHLDAPYHFSATGDKVGDIPLHKLILPLYVVDVSSQVNGDPDFVLHKHHLDYMLNVFDLTTPGLVLFKFGWTKFYSNPNKYLGVKSDNQTLAFPGGLYFIYFVLDMCLPRVSGYDSATSSATRLRACYAVWFANKHDNGGVVRCEGLSGELAELIVSSYRNVVGVGVDTASVDPGSSQRFPAHKALLQAGIYVLENVKMEVALPEIKCTAVVMPMKIRQGTGAPLRLAAICPKQAPRSFSTRDIHFD